MQRVLSSNILHLAVSEGPLALPVVSLLSVEFIL